MIDVIFPRGECKKYQEKNKIKAELVTKDEFDTHHRFHDFIDGPHKTDNFEEKQAYGKIKDGRIIYCELDEKMQELANDQIREKRKLER
jgi:hypothetical protein